MTVTDGRRNRLPHRKLPLFSEGKHTMLRLCIPESLPEGDLPMCHDARGHPSIRRTYSSISSRFHFPKTSRQVRRYVDNCAKCQLSKPSHEGPAGLLQPIEPPDGPFHTLCMDFIIGLSVLHGYDALLTGTDLFSKAVKRLPCTKTITAEETAHLFLNQHYSTFGLPSKNHIEPRRPLHLEILKHAYESPRGGGNGHDDSIPPPARWTK